MFAANFHEKYSFELFGSVRNSEEKGESRLMKEN